VIPASIAGVTRSDLSLRARGVRIIYRHPIFHLQGLGHFLLEVALCHTLESGAKRWDLIARKQSSRCSCIGIRMNERNTEIAGYFVLPVFPRRNQKYRVRVETLHNSTVLVSTIQDLVAALSQFKQQP
jgi:hypothetical protein